MPKRCLLPVLMLTMLLAALTAAPSAMAVPPPTTTTILTPADGSLATYNWQSHTGTIDVSGSTTGAITAVDIRCYQDAGGSYRNLLPNVPLDGGGNFSASNISLSAIDGYNCWLVAVPTGTDPTIPSADFHGVRFTVNSTGEQIDAGPSYDFYDFAGQSSGSWNFDSANACGAYAQLNDPTYNYASAYTFNCDQYFRDYKPSSASPEISGLQVNGLNAYGAYPFGDNGAATGGGFPSIVHSFTVNPITRDATTTETAGFSTCPANAINPNPGNCSTATDTGVTLSRTMQQNHAGLMVRISDVYKNNTGAPVTLNIAYQEDNYFGLGSDAPHLTYAFPNGASFVDGAPFAQINGPFASPSTIYISDPSKPDGYAASGRGALTMFPGADGAVMGPYKDTYYLQYNGKVIPAGGTYRIDGVFSQSLGQAQLDGLAAEATAALTPQPTFGAPTKSSLKYDKKKKRIAYSSGQSVLCPAFAQACAISGKLTAKVKLPAKKSKKAKTSSKKKKPKAKYKTYTLGTFSQTGAAGSTTALNLNLGATAIKLFKQYGKLNTTFVVNVTAGPYATATNTFVAKLKSPKFPKPKPKKKKKH